MAIRCCANVREEGRWPRIRNCKHPACVVTPDGKSYCKVHDPVAQKARDDAAQKKWDDRWAEQRRQDACYHSLAGLTDKQIEKLTTIDRNKLIGFINEEL